MAKLSQIKLGSTTYDIGAAWGNISGKPTEFTPSSHTHSYLPLSGGTLTGTVNSSGNMNLYGSNAYFSLGTSSSSNKCYFQTYNATTPGVDDANLKAGFGFGWSNSLIIDKSGNVTIPGDLIVSGGDITGNVATATKLQTARTIKIGESAQNFDGSANLTYAPFGMRLTKAEYGAYDNMNVVADTGDALGMANLTSTDTTISPGGSTGWHHYINMTWSDAKQNNNSTTNEWCTQIANKCGTTDLWVRSRSGGSITDGAAWVAPWTRILTGSNYTNVLDGRYVNTTGDTMTGLLVITTNGKSTTLGCQNNSYSHYSTNADIGHWFNKNTYVQGNIYAGSSYNKLVLTEENYTNYAATKNHTHSYLPLSGGTLTGGLTIANGADLNLQAPSGNTSDSGDLVFKNYSGTEIGRIWLGTNYFQVRFGPNDAAKILLTSGNYSDYAAAKNHNHDSAYLKLSGGTLIGLLNAHGGISLNSSTAQASGAPEYILGIKAFAEGGNVIWQNRANVSVGYADSAGTCTSLSTNAGSATKAIYFSGGKPVQCNDTINHNISGTAANSNILNINNSANLSSCLQYIQTSAQTSGNDLPSNTWWHVIKMNHGQGDTYYKRMLAFDFWNDNIMTSGAAGDGKTRTWKQVWIEGNSVTGAVWNDYAECRQSDCEEPGRALIENGDDTLSLATERLQQFAGISSDTWGFSQGETKKAKTHIAVAGRVLAYPYQNRDNYKPGDCVCTAPGGTVDIMTEEEIIRYPHRIVGIVSCVPDYEEWGGGEKADRDPVKVNGRIWIKVK